MANRVCVFVFFFFFATGGLHSASQPVVVGAMFHRHGHELDSGETTIDENTASCRG
jgi:hypothetical protein